MSGFIKVLLCIIELFIIMILCISIPFTLIGVLYPAFYAPSVGIVSIFGAGILGGDLICRACDGVGFSW